MSKFSKIFKVGDRLRADDLNEIAAAAFRSQQLPGTFQNGKVLLQAVGGAAANSSAVQLFKATTGITAAVGLLEADRGTGTVQPLDNATGEVSGDPIDIANPAFDAFTENSVGWMNISNSPPLLMTVFCTEDDAES